MPSDPRPVRTLLKLCKEFAEFDEVEVSSGGVTVRVRRRSGQALAPDQPKTKKQDQAKRTAIDSLKDSPPLFWNS
jgi:hypothetical protein